jgi:outer membrane protein assembly factor BamB
VRLGPDAFLISAGYGKGSAQFNLTHPQPALWQADETWKTLKMKAKCTNLVLHKNYIYGLDDGVFACQDPQDDGRLKWRDGKYGHGQCLLVGDLIVVTAETGELVLIDPSPEGLRELASIPVFNDKSWNPPTIAGEYLLMRNAQEAACFRLAVE